MPEKVYYSIREVSDILRVPLSTLRYWEKEFDFVKPKTNTGGTRFYSSENLSDLKMICYLLKTRKMTIEGARLLLKVNRDGVAKKCEVISKLREIKNEISEFRKTFESVIKIVK